jgi:hypothetical protein
MLLKRQKGVFKMKTSILILLTGCLLAFFPQPLPAANTTGNKAIKTPVKIVKNPPISQKGTVELSLEENLSIGNSENPNYFFYRLSGLAIDNNENIIALDSKNGTIRTFDANGKFIRSFGRKGPGPSELSSPSSLSLDKEGNIYVLDSNRFVKKFSKNGELLKYLKLDKRYLSMSADANGNIVLLQKDYGNYRNSLVTMRLLKKNMDGSTIIEFPKNVSRKAMFFDGDTQVFFSTLYFDANLIYTHSPNGNLYYGSNQSYCLHTYDTKNNKIREIFKEETPTRLSGAEKDQLATGSGNRTPTRKKRIREFLPDIKPYFMQLRVDEKEWLYVFKITALKGGGPYPLDIFDSDGQYIYRTESPRIPRIIFKGQMYLTTFNDAENLVIKRFKMTFKSMKAKR